MSHSLWSKTETGVFILKNEEFEGLHESRELQYSLGWNHNNNNLSSVDTSWFAIEGSLGTFFYGSIGQVISFKKDHFFDGAYEFTEIFGPHFLNGLELPQGLVPLPDYMTMKQSQEYNQGVLLHENITAPTGRDRVAAANKYSRQFKSDARLLDKLAERGTVLGAIRDYEIDDKTKLLLLAEPNEIITLVLGKYLS